MQRRPFRVRFPLALLTLVQLTVTGGAAWADARLGQGDRAPAHIESHSTAACVRIHPADCALHRFLSAPLAGHKAAVIRVRSGTRHRWTPVVPAVSRGSLSVTLHHSRAPPPVS